MTGSPARSPLEERMHTLIRTAVWTEALGRAPGPIIPLSEGCASRLPFYCVHGLSGAASLLSDLARMLGPEQPFFGIQAPSAKRNAAFAATIEGIAADYVDALMHVQPTGRLVLGGWSIGSIIAFEMAHQLRRRGREDILLVNIDCEFPNVTPAISRSNPLYYWRVARNFPLWLSYEFRENPWGLRPFFARIRRKLAALGRQAWSGVEGRRDHGHAVGGFMDMSRFSPDHRAFVAALYDALYRYVPTRYAGPVLIYEASVQPFAHLRQVAATWRTVTIRPDIVPVAGTHAGIIKAPDGMALAGHLRRRLAEFAAAGAPPRRAPDIEEAAARESFARALSGAPAAMSAG